MRCYLGRGERYSDACVLERHRLRGPSVMAWSDISFHGRSKVFRVQGNLTGHRYRDEILAPVVVPFFIANRNVTEIIYRHLLCSL